MYASWKTWFATRYSQDEISAEIIEAELKTGERPVVPVAAAYSDDLSIGQAVGISYSAILPHSPANCRLPASTSTFCPRLNIRWCWPR